MFGYPEGCERILHELIAESKTFFAFKEIFFASFLASLRQDIDNEFFSGVLKYLGKYFFVNSYFFACNYNGIILKCAHEHDIYRISEVHDLQEGKEVAERAGGGIRRPTHCRAESGSG